MEMFPIFKVVSPFGTRTLKWGKAVGSEDSKTAEKKQRYILKISDDFV
jgi:hypothetical protein